MSRTLDPVSKFKSERDIYDIHAGTVRVEDDSSET